MGGEEAEMWGFELENELLVVLASPVLQWEVHCH